jgi:hypothetical protein
VALEKNFSTRISDLAALKRIAASLGYVQTRGKEKGKGSIRALLEAIVQGELVVVRRAPKVAAAQKRDLDIQRMLLEDGLIDEIKPLDKRGLTPFQPIAVEGEPLSEMIVRERR